MFNTIEELIAYLERVVPESGNLARWRLVQKAVQEGKYTEALTDCLNYVHDVDFVDQVRAVAGSIKARADKRAGIV